MGDLNQNVGASSTNTSKESMPSPRHAQVIPSCIVPLFKRPFKFAGRVISATELVDWTAPEPLNDDERAVLLEQAVKRLKESPELVYSTRVGVPLHPDWKTNLPPEIWGRVQKAVDRIRESGIRPEDATIEQVKAVLNAPLARVLLTLARIEALSWNELNTVDLSRDSELQRKLLSASGFAWLNKVGIDDVRFRIDNGISLAQKFAMFAVVSRVSKEDANLIRSVYRAHYMSFLRELTDVAYFAEKKILTHGWRFNGKYSKIFIDSYIGDGGAPLCLSSLANKFDITRERVRQVLRKMIKAIGDSGESFVPTTIRIISGLNSGHFSSHIYGADNVFGHGVREDAVLQFARDVGVRTRFDGWTDIEGAALVSHYQSRILGNILLPGSGAFD